MGLKTSVAKGVTSTYAVRTALVRGAILALFFSLAGLASAQLTVSGFNAASVSLSSDGSFNISLPVSGWQLGGNAGAAIYNARIDIGTDNLGTYQELLFDYSIAASNRSGSIRVYGGRPVILFAVTYNNDSPNSAPFPVFSSYPANLLHLTYGGEFAAPSFQGFAADSPWIYFDPAGNTFIVSPASDYMAAATTRGPNGEIQAGISSNIATLPSGMVHRTALVYGSGPGSTMAVWGQTLTGLTGKHRPANDSGILLKSLSYWTDNGATYYYNAGGPSYTGTLEAIRSELNAKGITLGSMQLDSWWYPKGPDNSWRSGGGIWTYTGTTAIFQPSLAAFQSTLGVPLIAHARWIDVNSPLRTQYAMSGNIAIDPQYWEDTAAYLSSAGVRIYEQDWLGDKAHASQNLTDPVAFLNNMAASMAKHGITMQYCMADPAHFLQGTNYSNLTTIRSSGDRFGPTRWSDFLYSSRLASALGEWPFSDVFMSSETNNLILATLSGGPVGIGDALGTISQENLLKSIRPDGIIVKPDVAATPRDSVFIADAQGIDTPMVASAYSDFRGVRANYIFAFSRAVSTSLTIDPSSYGIAGAAYLYDYLNGNGYLIEANAPLTINLVNGQGYFVLVGFGPSGIAFLGDQGHFVTMGKKRITAFSDTGSIDVAVSFAAGEAMRTLFGFSQQPVSVSAVMGSVEQPVWDPATQLFTVNVHPSGNGAARVRIFQTGNTFVNPGVGVCGGRCNSGRPIPSPSAR